MEVIFFSVETVELFHKRALQEHGGVAGVRSRDLLESAVFHRNRAHSARTLTAALHRRPQRTGFSLRRISHSLTATSGRLRPACWHFYISTDSLSLNRMTTGMKPSSPSEPKSGLKR